MGTFKGLFGIGALKWGPKNWPHIRTTLATPRRMGHWLSSNDVQMANDIWKLIRSLYSTMTESINAAAAISNQTRWEKHPHEAIKVISEILDAHGVATVNHPIDADKVLLDYVNMGDSYVETIGYDYEQGRFIVVHGGWAGWYEAWEQANVLTCPDCGFAVPAGDADELERHYRAKPSHFPDRIPHELPEDEDEDESDEPTDEETTILDFTNGKSDRCTGCKTKFRTFDTECYGCGRRR